VEEISHHSKFIKHRMTFLKKRNNLTEPGVDGGGSGGGGGTASDGGGGGTAIVLIKGTGG